jgi:hypothetical protein
MRRALLGFVLFSCVSWCAPGCVIVPRYQREWLADPAMDSSGDQLAQRSLRKLHGTREGAAGGDGVSAGGGCACGQ